MMTTKRFNQAPPDKANELFDKLLTTSNNAGKTRERLFADLKEELELLATLQEEHLFPVLRRHLEQTIENSRRLAELTLQMADEATRTVTVQAGKTAERVSRVA